MSNGGSISGIVGAGLGLLALSVTAKVAMGLVNETGRQAGVKPKRSQTLIKVIYFDDRIKRIIG